MPRVCAIGMAVVLSQAGSMHFKHPLDALAPVAVLVWLLLWPWMWSIAGA